MLAPTIMTAARSMGAKMGRAAQPSLKSVSALAVPELPSLYLQSEDSSGQHEASAQLWLCLA